MKRSIRITALAALTAIAGFGVQAGTDATLSPLAWTTSTGEATEFNDAMARDSMASRAEVREELMAARSEGRLADTGEGGATERVLAQREAHVQREHDRLVAMNTPSESDALGEMIVAMSESDAWAVDTSDPLASEDLAMSLPDNADPSFATLAGLEDRWTDEPAADEPATGE